MNSQSARELLYRSLDAADHAEVNKQALMRDGRPPMPAWRMAITKGDATAVPEAMLRSGSFEGTSRPMIVTPPT